MEQQLQPIFLKWFEIDGIIRDNAVKPTTIANALSQQDFRCILSAGIRKLFDTLPNTNPLIHNVHIALKKVTEKISVENNGDNCQQSKKIFDIDDNTHFKILQFFDYKSLMKSSRVDKNWLYKTYDARSKCYFDSNELQRIGAIPFIRNLYSQFRLAENVALFPEQALHDTNFFGSKQYLLPNISKFQKIQRLILRVR